MDTSGEITAQVTAALQDGPYAAASLEMLSGGTANFVYRVVLSHPLKDGSNSVVVKQTEGFVALNPEFKLPENRCVSSILKQLISSAGRQHSYLPALRSSSRAFSLPWTHFRPLFIMQLPFNHQNCINSLPAQILKSRVIYLHLQPLRHIS
jgi:hypothetical protein